MTIVSSEASIGNYILKATSSINPFTQARQTTYSLTLKVIGLVDGDEELSNSFLGTNTTLVENGPVESLPGYVRISIGQNTAYTTPEVVAQLKDVLPSLTATVDADIAKQLEPPPLSPPTPTIDNTEESTLPEPTENNALAGVANDDSGQGQPNSAESSPIPTAAESPAQVALPQDPIGSSAPSEREDSETAAAPLGDPGTPPYANEGFLRGSRNGSRPGRRLRNPLSYLASYTYQLSLYMISPEAYEAFVASGRKNIEIFNIKDSNDPLLDDEGNILGEGGRTTGAYLVAQGAGMGPPEFRSSGFEYDYFIDGLSATHTIPGKGNQATSVTTDYKFKIIEPYGFSFISNLERAQNRIEQSIKNRKGETSSSSPDTSSTNANTTKNFFILGIRFFGWDQNGNQMTGSEIVGDGQVLDPNASGNGALFESYTEIALSEFKFKIDGRSTVYDIKAQPTAINGAINVSKGMNKDSKTVTGNTVRDMISGPNGLLTQINKEEQTLVKNGSAIYPIRYKVIWLGNDAEQIALSSVVTPNEQNKNNQPASQAANPDQSNPTEEIKAKPNKNITTDTVDKLPIVQGMEQIISKSSYIQDALTKSYVDKNENNPETDSPESVAGKGKKIMWFNISPQLSNIQWDEKRKDWVYDIIYIIETYLVPNVDSTYVDNTTGYYGPHKRYEYWYTGQNTEIIGYEQKIDNGYFLATLSNDEENKGRAVDNSSATRRVPNTQTGGDNSGSKGTNSLTAINGFRTSLYDPGSFATAKIQILGDPDFVMNSTTTTAEIYDRFYSANGYTVKSTGAQVFMEIDFKEAVDYTKEGLTDLRFNDNRGVTGEPGTLAINDSIEFWRYEGDVGRNIRGVSYQILTVSSNFNNGSFTQNISAVINQNVAPDSITEVARQEVDGDDEDE
jgi:hypothetical protein